uniref:Uncharacterized protein n=1 Tax=Anguilla anguilla TaxID=7936 RepID=A0A0E9XK21_ANGAN
MLGNLYTISILSMIPMLCIYNLYLCVHHTDSCISTEPIQLHTFVIV